MPITLQPVPTVGALAPDFTLPSTAGHAITLSSFRGTSHVLVAFFPLAFTSVCTAEMCAFAEDYGAYTAKDVVVLPVSIDAVPSLLEFKHKYEIPVELLSDMRRDVSAAYGVLLPEKWHSTRAYFLVDKSGVIRWAHVEEAPGQRRENAEILARIAELD